MHGHPAQIWLQRAGGGGVLLEPVSAAVSDISFCGNRFDGMVFFLPLVHGWHGQAGGDNGIGRMVAKLGVMGALGAEFYPGGGGLAGLVQCMGGWWGSARRLCGCAYEG